MSLQQLFLAPILGPKVVHRLPGRIRVHLAALHHLPQSHVQLLELIEAVLTVPTAIQTARACPTTGNILLTYDAKTVGEEEVVNYVQKVARMLAENWKSIAALSPSELIARKDHWIAAVESAFS
jgi:hypothetical protein